MPNDSAQRESGVALHDGLNSVFIELAETLVDEIFVKGVNVKIGVVVLQLVNRVTALFEPEVPVYADLKEGLLKKAVAMMTTVIGDPNGNEFVRRAVMLSGFFATYVLAEVVTRVGAERLQVSEDDMRSLRHDKLDAARELNTSPYSIFVPGFLQRLRSANDIEVKAPEVLLSQVKQERPSTAIPVSALPAESRDRPADQVMADDYVYTLRELNTVLKEVDRLPLASTFTGLTDSRSLSAFRNETDTLAKLRHWSPAHTFHYLSRAISPEVWQMVGPEIENELSGICYSNAISQLWSNLAQLCGGVVEDEKMLDQLLGLVQDEKESVLTFLSRVSTYRDQCRNSHMPYDDSFFIMISRRGLRSTALASQTAAVVANTWNDWVRTVAMLDRRSKQCQSDVGRSQQGAAVIDLTGEDRSGTGTVATATLGSAYPRVRRCYNCGKTGHLARQCTADKGPRKCWNCSQTGHLASACPNREGVSSQVSEQAASKTEAVTTKAAVINDGSRGMVAHEGGVVETVIIPSRTVTFQNSQSGQEEDVGGALLTAWWEGVPLRGLVDTGAADALLSYERYCALQSSSASVISLEKTSSSIQLADGSMRAVAGMVKLALRFSNGVTLVHPFYVVQGLCPSVIWGVKLLARLGTSVTISECEQGVRISTSFVSEGQKSKLLCDQSSDTTVTTESVVPDILAVRCCGDSYAVSSDIEELASEEAPSEVESYTPNGENDEPKCDSYVFDWRRVPAAPNYFYRVREVRADDVIDCPGQRYVCEVRLPNLCATEETKKVVDYSSALLSKLSTEQKRLYFKEIDSYIANSWWKREKLAGSVEKGNYYNNDDHIIIFGLPQSSLKSTVMRPVADCRRLNSRMEKASFAGENVGAILSEIALAVNAVSEMNNETDHDDGVCMACLDISRAFYRLRLCSSSGCLTRLWLRTCHKWYSTSRLIFGLAAGPSGLEAFVLRILALAKQAGVLDGVYSWAYLDDLTLIGTSSKVRRAVLVIRELAALHGLPIPASKTVILCSHGPSLRSRHLGVFWDVAEQHLTVSCATFEKPVVKEKFSKRQLFSVVGKWHDGLRRHPEWSLAADTCRMIAGRWTLAWDKPHLLSAEEKKVLTTAFAMVEDGIVSHSHNLPVRCGTTIVAQCDASTVGYGWLWFLEGADQQPLCMRARWWKGGRRFWFVWPLAGLALLSLRQFYQTELR